MSQNELQIFDPVQAEISGFATPSMQLTVGTPDECMTAMDCAKQIKRLEKAVEERRKQLVDPLNARVKMINAYAKKLLEPVLAAEKHLKGQMITWEKKLEAERVAQAKKLELERRAKEAELAAKKAEEDRKTSLSSAFGPSNEVEKIEPSSVEREAFESERALAMAEKANEDNRVKGAQKYWTFEIVDESQIPDGFFSLDPAKIRFEIVSRGIREIPGIKIYQETRLSIR